MTITLRSVKGSSLTFEEMDENFSEITSVANGTKPGSFTTLSASGQIQSNSSLIAATGTPVYFGNTTDGSVTEISSPSPNVLVTKSNYTEVTRVTSSGLSVTGTISVPTTGTSANYGFSLANTGGTAYVGLDSSTGSVTGVPYSTAVVGASSFPVILRVGGSNIATASSSGLAVTGALSVSGATQFNDLAISNNGKGHYWYEPGTTTWMRAYSPSANVLSIGGSYGEVLSLSALGLAVTGTLSASGNISPASGAWLVQKNGASNVAYIGDGSAATGGTANDTVIRNDTGNIYLSAGTSIRATLTQAGNLGIGVTPSAWYTGYKAIEIGTYSSVSDYPNSGGIQIAANASHSSNDVWNYKNSYYASMYQQGEGKHIWHTATSGTAGNPISFTQAMTLDASGSLTLAGNQLNFNNAGSTIEFVNRDTGVKEYRWYYLASGASPYASLTTSGVWTNASDARGKENISAIHYGLSAVMALQPRQYDVKSDGSHAIGFVAQEVLPVIPEVVHGSETESYSLDYGSIAAVLVKAIQEQQALIESLTARVAQLEG